MNATLKQELRGAAVTVTKEFITAGYAIFTVGVPEHFQELNSTKPHYTFMVRRMAEKDGLKSPMFASLLTGPDNTSDYQYIGIVNEAFGRLHLTKKSKLTTDCWPVKILSRVLLRIFAGQQEMIGKFGFTVNHCGKCARCGAVLTTPKSIAAGFGPECLKIISSGK